jgi:hypothetical protein
MSSTAPHTLADRLAITTGEMRAALAPQGTRKGPAAALQAAILSLLEYILALLVEFQAGRLVAAPGERAARVAAGAAGSPSSSRCAGPSVSAPGSGSHCASAMGTRRGEGEFHPGGSPGTAAASAAARAAQAVNAGAGSKQAPCPAWSVARPKRLEGRWRPRLEDHELILAVGAIDGARVPRMQVRYGSFSKIGVAGAVPWCVRYSNILHPPYLLASSLFRSSSRLCTSSFR